MMTTNFSITYFAVANEIEGSGMPACVAHRRCRRHVRSHGLGGGKFDADKIVKTIKTTNIESKISHKKIVIPGAVAVLSGEVEGEMPGWSIMVGRARQWTFRRITRMYGRS